mgnify:CR=1 FL=1
MKSDFFKLFISKECVMIKKIMIMGLGIFAVSLSLAGLQAEASRIDE